MFARVLVLVACLSAAASAQTVVDAPDHPAAGGFRSILDAQTHLLWMDLSYTLGQAYNDVARETSGGQYDGWRIASNDEARTLMEHAGVPFTRPFVGLGYGPPGEYLLSIWSGAGDNFFNHIRGRQINFATSSQTIRNREYDFGMVFVTHDGAYSGADIPVSTVRPDTGIVNIGVALVKEVPEPAGCVLLLLGLLGPLAAPLRQ